MTGIESLQFDFDPDSDPDHELISIAKHESASFRDIDKNQCVPTRAVGPRVRTRSVSPNGYILTYGQGRYYHSRSGCRDHGEHGLNRRLQHQGELCADLEGKFGASVHERIDAPATFEQKAILENLSAALKYNLCITKTDAAL